MRRKLAKGGAILGATSLFGGCDGIQSILAPHGPVAGRIAVLIWVLFGIGVAIFLIVLGVGWMAIRGSRATRSWLGNTAAVVVGGIALPTTILTGLLAYGVWLTRPGIGLGGGNVFHVEVVGEQWWWRVSYVGSDGQRIASANEIRIPVGVPVEFTLGSADVVHSFWVPNLGGKVDMMPGHTTTLRVVAERPGVFRGQCAEYCGGPHALMALQVVAMPPPEHRRWLLAQAAPAAEPRSEVEKSGKSLFLSAGCGGCHTVRGTDAAGTIGPDLTHVGGRLSLAGATLPNNKASLVGWIRDNQHIKPNNLMPEFRNFTDTEIEAVAAYLESLK